jgi:hypothetical protein
MESSPLTIWTIYDRPTDYPDSYVVRPWILSSGSEHPIPGAAVAAPDLDAARDLVPAGSFRMERNPDDDPCIVETWF